MYVIEVEQGSVIYGSRNETTFLTIATFAFSTLGLALSTAALILLFLTALMFAEWRKIYKNKLLIQFMLARFFYTSVRYYYDLKNVLGPDNDLIFFELLGIVYTEVALVSWMFVFSRQMYDSLVKVFQVKQFSVWKLSLTTWMVPAIISISMQLMYQQQYDRDFRVFLTYLFLIKWPLLVANAILLILGLKSVLKNNKSKPENNLRITIVMFVLIFTFGFQQIIIDICKILHIVYLNYYNLSYVMLIGNMFSMYQCAFSITFWVFGNVNTRKLWKGKRVERTLSLVELNSSSTICAK